MTKHFINLWSSPRNVSTALMYSFAQRSDCRVVDEPLYAHYLSKQQRRSSHPGEADILASQSHDGRELMQDDMLKNQGSPVVFYKNMSHHFVCLDESLLLPYQNVLLSRHPKAMLLSFSRNIAQPQIQETGYDKQLGLLNYLRAAGQDVPVIVSEELLKNPHSVLEQLCRRLDIPFEEAMLAWPQGPKDYDGVWAPYWYANAHQSSCFAKYQASEQDLPEHLREVYERCLESYQVLAELAIRAE